MRYNKIKNHNQRYMSLQNIRARFMLSPGIVSVFLSILAFGTPVYASMSDREPTFKDIFLLLLISVSFLFPVVIFFHGVAIWIKHIHDKHLRGRGTHKMSLGFLPVFLIGYAPLIFLFGYGIREGLLAFINVLTLLFTLILLARGLFLWIKYRKIDVVLKKRGRMKVSFALYNYFIGSYIYYSLNMLEYLL